VIPHEAQAGQEVGMSKQIRNIIWMVALLLPLSAFAERPAMLFVFDGSASMLGQVDGKAKIDLAKKAMSGLLKGFPDGADIGLIAYGHRRKGDCSDIEMLAPVGSGRETVIKAVQSIKPRGKTPLTSAIRFAAEKLKGRDAPTSIVVISDGEESCNADPCAAADAVRQADGNLQVHVIGFDVKGAAAKQLQCIASNGGGKYYTANDANELASSFAAVKKEVSEPAAQSSVVLQDDFNGDNLSGQWEMMNPNEDSMIVEDGFLQIITNVSRESFFNPTNFALLKQELPGQYEVILKMRFARTDSRGNWRDNQSAGLMLFKDKQNGIVLAASNNWGNSTWNTDAIHFSKMRNKEWLPDFTANLKGAVKGREITLRLQRIKRKFIASYLDAKGQWQNIGEFTELRAKYRVGVYAARGGSAHEEMELFDAFTLKEIK